MAGAVSAGIVLEDLTIPGAPGGPPLATIARLTIPFGVAFGMRSAVEVEGLRVHAVRGGDDDNVEAILEKVRGRHAGAAGKSDTAKPEAAKPETAKPETAQPDTGKPETAQTESTSPGSNRSAGPSIPDVIFHDAAIEARDAEKHLQLSVAGLDGELRPGVRLALRMRGVKGGLMLGGEGEGPHFGADELDIETPLTGLMPSGIRHCGWRAAMRRRCHSCRSPGSPG